MSVKRNGSLLTSCRWLLRFSGGRVIKIRERSEAETEESHAGVGGDSKERKDHAVEG